MDGFQIASEMLSRDYLPTRQPLRGLSWESRVSNAATLEVFAQAVTAARPAWHDEAACADSSVSVFFSSRGRNSIVAEAKRMCASCPVVDECLEYALENGIKHGTWGGKSENERRPLRKKRKEAA